MSSSETPPEIEAEARVDASQPAQPPPDVSDQPVDESALTDEHPWRRLDPRMLLVHPVVELLRFLPALVGILFLGSRDRSPGWALLAVAAPVVFGVWRYLTTSFRFTPTHIELRRGILSRRVLSARLDRVRSVDLNSTLMHRLLGLAEVKIGTTASGGDDESFSLNALRAADARELRATLLHRTPVSAAAVVVGNSEVSAATEGETAPREQAPPPVEEPDEVLVTFDRGWIKYAPFNGTGLAIGLGGLALLNQVSDNTLKRIADDLGAQSLAHAALWVLVVLGVFCVLLVLLLLQVASYVAANWGFTFSRDRAGRSWHVRRGLFTTRETSVDTERVRGVQVREPLLLRLAGGRQLAAIAAGAGGESEGTIPLVPSAPRAIVEDVASTVTDPVAVTGALVGHGPRATRRRWSRALLSAAFVVAVLVALSLWVPGREHLPDAVRLWVPLGTALVLFPVAVLLAVDRSRTLGHQLTGRWFAVRSGSLGRSRDVLHLDGVIGWNFDQSFFQRRAGLVNLTATTAAGDEGYTAIDVPEEMAVALAGRAMPELLDQFRA